MPLDLDVDAFREKPSRADVTTVQRDAAQGRFGPGQDAAAGKYGTPRSAAATGALFVGGVFGLTTLVIAFADPELLPTAIGLTVVATALTAVGVFLATARARSRQWQRHARVARFARDNGMELRLVASEEEVPPMVIPRTKQPAPVTHHDVATRRRDGLQLAIGTRVRQVATTSSTDNGTYTINVPRHLTWAALRPDGGIDPARQERVRQRLQSLDDVRLMLSSSWVVVGVENDKDTSDRLPELLILIDRAAVELGVQDEVVPDGDRAS